MTFVLIMGFLLAAADEPQHSVLTCSLDVWDISVRDIDGDGANDLIALCGDENSSPLTKHAAVFLANDSGVLPSTPQVVLPLAANTGAAFIAEVNGRAGAELVVTSPVGAVVYGYQGGRFEEMLSPRFNSLLPGGSRFPRFLPTLAEDLNGDGIDEWLIPVAGGYSIRNAEKHLADVACDVVSEVRSGPSTTIFISHRLPQVHAFSLAGDDQKALAFLNGEVADFAHGDQWSERTRFEIPMTMEEQWATDAQLHDISGNGLPDLVVTQTKGTINVTVRTEIYLATEPFAYPEEPSALLESKSAFAAPLIKDLNDDKKLDLLYIKVPYGIPFFVNLFLRRKVSVKAEAYHFGEGGFASSPDYTATLTVEAPDGREQAAYTLGDFNGDGAIDLAVGSGKTKLVIRPGEKGGFLASKAWKTLQVVPFGEARTYRINDNNCDDLVIFHPSGSAKKSIDIIVF
jgi:hypothetical protein